MLGVGTPLEIPVHPKLNASIRNIEEFVPDDYLDKSFLEETDTSSYSHQVSANNESDR